MSRRAFIAGNWKMNLPPNPTAAIDHIASPFRHSDMKAPGLLICPPAPFISQLSGLGVRIGGQNCHEAAKGAHTGDVSAELLAKAGASHVILGHSERRTAYHETDQNVADKATAAWRAELTAIICVGESQEQRDAGYAISAVTAQVASSIPSAATSTNTILAYEPVWAIGSGRAASASEIAEIHGAIREKVASNFGDVMAAEMRILYGGSVTPANAAEIFALEDVDGGLVGGASLNPSDFIEIAKAAVN